MNSAGTVDPRALFARLRRELPGDVLDHIVVVGSLAAAYRELRHHVMSAPIGGRLVERYAKDLGRVLALARLASREDVEAWAPRWLFALQECFPTRWPDLAASVGAGLRALLEDAAFEEAWHCCNVGLLANMGVTETQLRAIARQVIADAIEPVEAAGHDA